MGLFSRKDWNVVGIMFEHKKLYQINANRGKGGKAEKIRDGVKRHERTICWAVFDQKGGFVESGMGPSSRMIPTDVLKKLMRELPTISSVRSVLATLESGDSDKAAKQLAWQGYPEG